MFVPLKKSKVLLSLLKDSKWIVRLAAAERLRFYNVKAEKVLVEAFRHPSPFFRAYALSTYWNFKFLKQIHIKFPEKYAKIRLRMNAHIPKLTKACFEKR